MCAYAIEMSASVIPLVKWKPQPHLSHHGNVDSEIAKVLFKSLSPFGFNF